MAIPIIGALLSKIGSSDVVSGASKALKSPTGQKIMGALKDIGGNDSSEPVGLEPRPTPSPFVPFGTIKLDKGFYGHMEVGNKKDCSGWAKLK
jgi:hypothetical protein